jgi:citrate lyase subunit beta/citryl-CoA lyase
MTLLRSLLFAPANRPELIKKFPRYRADAFAIDLEDGTPERDKAAARKGLAANVAYLREQNLEGRLLVRVNERRSPHAAADVAAALGTAIDGLVLPKLGKAADLAELEAELTRAEASTGRALVVIGLIETAEGVVNVEALASSGHAHLAALAFGAEDFITDIGGRRTAEGLEVLYARSRVVLAARAAGLEALDQVYVEIRNTTGFRRDAERGRDLGYGGKMCIVPPQVEMANEVFSPSPQEIERSRRLIAAYEDAKREGRGAIVFEGTMVDEPMLKRAAAIVALATRLR